MPSNKTTIIISAFSCVISIVAAMAAWQSASSSRHSVELGKTAQQVQLRPYIIIQPTTVGIPYSGLGSFTLPYILENKGVAPAVNIRKEYISYIIDQSGKEKLVQHYEEPQGKKDALAPSQISAIHEDQINISGFKISESVKVELIMVYRGFPEIDYRSYYSKSTLILTPRAVGSKVVFIAAQPYLDFGFEKVAVDREKGIEMDNNLFTSFLYFYSTMAQSIAALIALFGIFAVFRIQYSNIQIENSFHLVRNFIVLKCFIKKTKKPRSEYSFLEEDFDCWLDKDIPPRLRQLIMTEYNIGERGLKDPPIWGFVDYYLFVNTLESFKNKLKSWLLFGMICLSIIFIISIIALYSLKYWLRFWSNPLVVGLLIMGLFFILILIIWYAYISVKGPHFIDINNNETDRTKDEGSSEGNKHNLSDFSIKTIQKIIKELLIIRGKVTEAKEFIAYL